MGLTDNEFLEKLKRSPEGQRIIEEVEKAESQAAQRERAVAELQELLKDNTPEIARLRDEEEKLREKSEQKREEYRKARQEWQETNSRLHADLSRRTQLREQLRGFLAATAPVQVDETEGVIRWARDRARLISGSGISADVIRQALKQLDASMKELQRVRHSADPTEHLGRVQELREHAYACAASNSIKLAIQQYQAAE